MNIVVVARVRDEDEVLPWFLANLKHADTIILVDGGSKPGFLERLEEAQLADPFRVRVRLWGRKVEPFFEETEHMRFAMQCVIDEENQRMHRGEGAFDWIHYADVDEIPNLDFQRQIRTRLVDPFRFCERVGVECRFLYLAPGWTHYYEEPSRHPSTRIFNHIPEVISDKYVSLRIPDQQISLPDECMILHFNWAMKERFERKMKWYEKRFQQPAWHPDSKFLEQTLLPNEAVWRNPEGRVTTPALMYHERRGR